MALDSKQGVVHTIRCTAILPMGESSDEFGNMAIIVVVEYTGDNAVPRTDFDDSIFGYFRMLGFVFVNDVQSRLW